MSSYIIAGSADSLDTAYCEEIARRINAKYKNIDFRIVIKHASQWQDYLQQICRIYGFLKKSNPIIYTFDGKIIGGKDNFLQTATKYFGIDEEQLIVEELSSKTNTKLAEEEVKAKKIQKSNYKTLEERILLKHKELLSKGIVKYGPKQKESYLVNGIEYTHLELEGLAQPMKFIKEKMIPIINEQIEPEDINLASLTLQDQIKPEQTIAKQAFVTANQKLHSQHDRLSEASKSKMHQSVVSNDKQSKGVKQSNNTKLRIDQQNDQIPDYIDYPMKDTVVCELADSFCVAFEPKSIIGEEMYFYLNVDTNNGNAIRMHNDGRPIKGHRVIIREIHYQDIESNAKQQQMLEEIPAAEIEEVKDTDDIQPQGQGNQNPAPKERQRKMTLQIQKSKTEPNIPAIKSQQMFHPEDAVSEPNSDLNLVSHLNHHTLFIHKPLSLLQLKNLFYFVGETNTVATLQFLPENPNPRVKLHARKLLLGEQNAPDFTFPVERFIFKQLEDKEYSNLTLPSENSQDFKDQSGQIFKAIIIEGIGFNHLIYRVNGDKEEKLNKIIKYGIDHFLSIEEQVQRDIGYNLVITKQHLLIVPIVEACQVYNNTKLYLDGLSYLGYVHTAKLAKPYQINEPKAGNHDDQGVHLRKMLAVQSGYKLEE